MEGSSGCVQVSEEKVVEIKKKVYSKLIKGMRGTSWYEAAVPHLSFSSCLIRVSRACSVRDGVTSPPLMFRLLAHSR